MALHFVSITESISAWKNLFVFSGMLQMAFEVAHLVQASWCCYLGQPIANLKPYVSPRTDPGRSLI